jgi:hypothetical protein
MLGPVRMPAWPPSVSEDTVEASATAMADEMERVRDLPRNDDDDMGDEDLPGVVLGSARALACCRARWHGTTRLKPDRVVPGLQPWHSGTIRHDTMGPRASPCHASLCRGSPCPCPCHVGRSVWKTIIRSLWPRVNLKSQDLNKTQNINDKNNKQYICF